MISQISQSAHNANLIDTSEITSGAYLERPMFWLHTQVRVDGQHGHWSFVLRRGDGQLHRMARDVEVETSAERLELLALLRGLESLDGAARVVVLTPRRYVFEGIRHGAHEWAANHWRWEWHDRMVPVKHADLWKRLCHVRQFHDLDCRLTTGASDPTDPGRAREPIETNTNRTMTTAWERLTTALGLRLASPGPA